MKSYRSLLKPNFSHIYVEKRAQAYPEMNDILRKFPRSTVIEIEDYKRVFNRSNQNFQAQKKSLKLIIAVKKDHFIYNGSQYAPNFDLPNFYYNTVMLNCLYNCDYCYLQGMFISGNIVIFINFEDFVQHAEKILKERGSIYLCVSYDTDLLAFEKLVPNCRRWIEWAESWPNALVEIRTKSANFPAIADLPKPQNTIMAWTLSPWVISKENEKKTPGPGFRLKSIKMALNLGWKVRICFDPLIRVQDWERAYREMVEQIADSLPLQSVYDFSIGVFRMNRDYLHKIRKIRKESSPLFYPFKAIGKVSSYNETEKNEIVSFVKNLILEIHPKARIF